MKTNGIISEFEYRAPKYRLIYGIMLALLLVLVVICLFPPLWVIISAGKDVEEFYRVPPTLLPKSFNPGKIVSLFKTHSFLKYYVNTFSVCIGSVVFSVVINGLMGYSLSKMKVKGAKFIFGLILASYLLPNTVSMVPVYKAIIKFPILGTNLLNTNWPMWLMAGTNAFMVIVYKGFFDDIPDSLLEAGRLDGCTDSSLFTKIVLPLSKPVMFTSVILTFNAAWGDFFWPYMVLRKKETYTIMVDIFVMQQEPTITIDTILIAIAVAIIPPAILFMFFQKNIMQGFTMSGIKG